MEDRKKRDRRLGCEEKRKGKQLNKLPKELEEN